MPQSALSPAALAERLAAARCADPARRWSAPRPRRTSLGRRDAADRLADLVDPTCCRTMARRRIAREAAA